MSKKVQKKVAVQDSYESETRAEEVAFYGEHKLDLKEFNFNVDKSKGTYELDVLQSELINFYLRNDSRFRRAYNFDYTSHFVQYLKDKARLKEPIKLSVMGQTRTGKSYSSLSLQALMMAFHGKLILPKYICGNAYHFLERLQSMPLEHTTNTCFLRDEDKQPFGVGSISKKAKLSDTQNIIAKHNVSSISLCPIRFADGEADYGLRTLGRNFVNGSVRFMLYNLQESKRTSTPMGMIYLPIFNKMLPEWYSKPLEKAYLEMKDEWIKQEIQGKNDVLYDLKRKTAEAFLRDKQLLSLKKKSERMAYISIALGSEWTTTEKSEVLTLVNLLERGIRFKDD